MILFPRTDPEEKENKCEEDFEEEDFEEVRMVGVVLLLLLVVARGETLITDAEIEAALASLGEADLDYRDGNLTFVVNPTLYADLLNNPKFVRYDALGTAGTIANGRLGEIYGIPVEMSNALVDSSKINNFGLLYRALAMPIL